MVENGTFREDLYYRLDVFTIQLPPLRERRGDLGPLVASLIGELAQKLELPVPSISRSLLARLEAHDWPGNVRELMNSLETAMILGRGDGLELPDEFSRRAKRELASGAPRFESAVRVAIEEALRATRGKIYGSDGAASRLGLKPGTLQDRVAWTADGRISCRLKRPWHDGRSALCSSQKPCCGGWCGIIPPPRRHLVRYHRIFGPEAGHFLDAITPIKRARIHSFGHERSSASSRVEIIVSLEIGPAEAEVVHVFILFSRNRVGSAAVGGIPLDREPGPRGGHLVIHVGELVRLHAIDPDVELSIAVAVGGICLEEQLVRYPT
ncbi:MAG: Formate hydrogenlyase transcriptional activator, partial [bacterium]|nr:Formate hydrogenlyase transcriptional activator [bacterium]